MTCLRLIPTVFLITFLGFAGCTERSVTGVDRRTGAVRFTDGLQFGTPVNLGPTINSSQSELQVGVAPNGKSLFFSSDRTGTFGIQDIWVSHMQSDGSWGTPVNIGPVVNSTATDTSPTLSIDGHWLYFASRRAGGFGGLDCWRSFREDVEDDTGWEPPQNLGPSVNSVGDDADCLIRRDELGHETLWFTSLNRPGGEGDWDIYTSVIGDDGSFGPATPVSELNTAARETRMTLSGNGRRIFFTSNRAGGFGGIDVWMAERPSPNRPFCEPVNLGAPVNTSANDRSPSMTTNGAELYFTSTRAGGYGSDDVYVVSMDGGAGPSTCPPHGE